MNIWKSCAGQVTTGLKNSDNLFNYTINVSYKKVYLKPGKEESLKRFHPWVFSGAIARVEESPKKGK